MIHNVEEFHSELHVELFGDSLYIVVLKQRQVQVDQPRADDAVPSAVAQEVRAGARDARVGYAWRGERS